MGITGFRAVDSYIDDRSIVHSSVEVYRSTRITESTIEEDSIITDNTDILYSQIGKRCSVGRRNFLYKTFLNDGSYTGPNSVIRNCEIGKYCCISWGVSLGGRNHNYESACLMQGIPLKHAFGVEPEPLEHDPFCLIGNDVWIASNATVIEGVHIGDGAVVGGGAVVIKDIPPYAVVAGVPARVIKYRFSEQIISRLSVLRWWDWDIKTIQKVAPLLQKKLSNEILDELESVK